MRSTLIEDAVEQTPTTGSTQRPVSLSSLVAVVVGVPLLLCVLSFFVVDSSWFQAHADPQWVRSSDQIFQAHGVECDVVVYGDSSAITGIDPAVIQRKTGLRTCNIAQTKAALVVLGTSALDRFLHNNPRPRYLILQFTGADFYQPHSWLDTNSYMEGVVALLRFYPAAQFVHGLLRHPEVFTGMMHYAYITGPLNMLRNHLSPHGAPPDPSLLDVHFIRPEPSMTNCTQAEDIDPIFHKPDPQYVRNLRRHYSGMADHLLIDAAPLSECDSRYDYLRKHLSGLDNAFEKYPVNLYNEGYAHYTAEGSRRLTQEIAGQLLADGASGTAVQTARASGEFPPG